MVVSPSHLGDAVMALPAIDALAKHGPIQITGPSWAADVYAHLLDGHPGESKSKPHTAVLFKPSFSAAWAVRKVPVRVGISWDARWPLLTHAVVSAGRHRCDDFAALVQQVTQSTVSLGLPQLPTNSLPSTKDLGLPARFALILPGTASVKTVRWPHFSELANHLQQIGLVPIFAGGPVEEEWLPAWAAPHRHLPTLSLRQVASVATKAERIVGNDSGLTHLAAAALRGAGRPVSNVHVVYGSTDPTHTGPPGATHHIGGQPSCWACYAKTCSIGTPTCFASNVDAIVTKIVPND